MPQGVRDLTAFYHTPLGRMARRAILGEIQGIWPNLRNYRLLGYGFALPYLRAFAGTERTIAALPAAIGPTGENFGWPPDGKNATLLCEEDALPFPDMFFDRILIVHGLESSEGLRALLRQIWRVLAPEGRILLVAPNRASLWAQVQRSPFGHGRPFSKMELEGLLTEGQFESTRWSRALYAPPFETVIRSGAGWEKVGARLFSGIGGVHVVEAAKSLYATAKPGLPQGATIALKASN
ncbi:MAG TPA: methyltransferase domain-containing protein [Rhizomicrobium sp.]|nr:methyltransferase domain-containing protein [Rhizomicrobium sp.]